MYYSLVGLLAALVLVITNHDVLLTWMDEPSASVQRCYHRFLLAVMAYYITDMLWGVLDSLSLTVLLFWDTEVYYLTMGLGVLFWTQYVIAYLDEKNLLRTFLHYAGRIVFVFQIVLAIGNLFVPILFQLVEDGAYHAGPARHAMLIIQIVIFLLTAVYALHVAARTDDERRNRYRTIGMFGVIMAALLSVQFFYPLLPLYSIGYMLGTCFLRTFIIENENREYRRELEAAFQREQRQEQELSSAWQLAYTDPLTGVKSKTAHTEKERQLDTAIADGKLRKMAVIVFDVNGLKLINDTLGHDAGDDCIRDTCRLICETFQHSPVYRVGGDEFVVILEGADYESRGNLLHRFNQRIEENRRAGRVVVAAGMAEYIPAHDYSYERVFKRADRLMYLKKEKLKQADAPAPQERDAV